MPPTAEGAAGVDAPGPQVGLVGVTDAVVEGDENADGREEKAEDQQGHHQGVKSQRGSSDFSQHLKHCTQTQGGVILNPENWIIRKVRRSSRTLPSNGSVSPKEGQESRIVVPLKNEKMT